MATVEVEGVRVRRPFQNATARPSELFGSMLDFLGVERGPEEIEQAIPRDDRQPMAERWERRAPLTDADSRTRSHVRRLGP